MSSSRSDDEQVEPSGCHGPLSHPPGLRFEVLVIANNCTDRTCEVATRFADRLPLVCLEEPRQGVSFARNTGIAAAKGELVVFADDDVQPCRELMALYWYAFKSWGDGCYFAGPLNCECESGLPLDEHLHRVAPVSVRGQDLQMSGRTLADVPILLEANWACPADILRRSGGFDARLGLDASLKCRRVGEGPDLRDRLGLTGIYVGEAYVVHFVPRCKCTLRHAGAGWRAHGYYSLHAETPNPFLERSPWLNRPLIKSAGRDPLVEWR
jgi:glycosyltransferase involved in cell wall biosynthesis